MITYNHLMLFLLGVLGMLIHNFVKLNEINKATNGGANIIKYWKLEMYAIFVNFLIIIVCVITSQEIKELANAGKILGVAFVAIGYMGQSLFVAWMGTAQKKLSPPDSTALDATKEKV